MENNTEKQNIKNNNLDKENSILLNINNKNNTEISNLVNISSTLKLSIQDENKPTKKRNHGLDLLRLLASFMVITYHIMERSDCNFRIPLLTYKRYYSLIIFFWAHKCNVVFGILSGYVGLNSRHKIQPIILLMISTTIYSLIIQIYCMIKSKKKYNFSHYFFMFFPGCTNKYWFYTSHVGLLFFTPYINLGIKNLNKIQSNKICVSMYILFSFIVSFFNSEVFGARNSVILFWLIVYYYYGAHIKCHGIFLEKYSKLKLFFIYVFCLLFNVFLIFLSDLNKIKGKNKYYSLYGFFLQTNPVLLICAFCELIFFKNLEINDFLGKIISNIAPSCFFIYILGFNQIASDYYRIYYINDQGYLRMLWTFIYKNILTASICLSIDFVRRFIFNILNISIIAEKIAQLFEYLIDKCFNNENNEISSVK